MILSNKNNLFLLVIFLVSVVIISAHNYFFDLTWSVAYRGFSLIEYVNSLSYPDNFLKDYPGGSRTVSSYSVLSFFYKPIQELLSLTDMQLLHTMISLEVICMIVSTSLVFFILSRLGGVDKNANEILNWASVWLCLVLLTSFHQGVNLANFGFPYYHGQFYGFADSLRLMAIGFAFKRRWALTALFLFLGFTFHPIKSIVAASFICALFLVDWQKSLNPRNLAIGFLCVLTCVIWAFGNGLVGSSSFEQIPAEDYVSFSRLLQSHFFPADLGFLSHSHWRILSPFLGLLLMFFFAIYQSDWPDLRKNQLLIGSYTLLGLSMLGIFISIYSNSPFLIELCLIRASTLITLIAPIIIMISLVQKWRKGEWFWVAVYGAFLFTGFLSFYAMTPFIAIMAIVATFIVEKRLKLGLLIKLIVVIIWSVWLFLTYDRTLNKSLEYLLFHMVGIFVFTVFFLASKAFLKSKAETLLLFLTTIVFLTGSLFWSVTNRMYSIEGLSTPRKLAYVSLGNDYYKAQLWAKKNTANNSLFMVSPCINYGWRDFSVRSSVGTPREWLMVGWIYSKNINSFKSGIAYAELLGLDLNKYRFDRHQKLSRTRRDLCDDALKLFYDPSLKNIARFAEIAGVNYFVMKNDKLESLGEYFTTSPIYKNNQFSIYKSSDLFQ